MVPAAEPGEVASRVVILANSEDPDSLRIAQHYAAARAVPAANIIALPLPIAEEISWPEFVASLWQPLRVRLMRDKWIDAIAMDAIDGVGRQKFAVYSTRIAALVTCRGVPLKIRHDPALYAELRPFTGRGEFRTNAGAVDSELSLLGFSEYPINAFVPNPLYQNDRPSKFELSQVVRVSRLDGPTAADAMGLVDRALAAERNGLLGRAYVDLAQRDPIGDGWLEAAGRQLAALDFDVAIDRERPTFPATARLDAPALYFGWYSGAVDGPFALPGFAFPPGAIAVHIHSFSASSLRTSNRGWTGAFIARGVTGTVGNVYEPYLQFTHRPNLLLRSLARGATLVEAAYYSVQALSWQQIVIGDPLYRPFAVSLADQLRQIDRLPPQWAPYATLREMRRLEAARQPAEAIAIAIAAQKARPSLSVGLALAQLMAASGDRDGAASALGFVSLVESLRTDEWALAREIAQFLESCGRPNRALDVWRLLLGEKALPPNLRGPWLREAALAAGAANDVMSATAWEKEADTVAPPAK